MRRNNSLTAVVNGFIRKTRLMHMNLQCSHVYLQSFFLHVVICNNSVRY